MQLNLNSLPVPLSPYTPGLPKAAMPICSRCWRVWPVAAQSRMACVERCIVSAEVANLAECNYAVETGIGGPAILQVVGQPGIEALNALCRACNDWSWMETLHYGHDGVQLYIFEHSQPEICCLAGYEGLFVHWDTHVLIPPSRGAVYVDSEASVLRSPHFLWAEGIQ